MVIVAIVGMPGAGKTEIARIFELEGFRRIRFGDVTDDILKQQGLPITEEFERPLREELRKKHGMEAYAKLLLPKIQAAAHMDVVLDGMRSWEEYKFLSERFSGLSIIAVYSPPKVRYERLAKREDRPVPSAVAKVRDHAQLEQLNMGPTIAMADFTLVNTGTKEELRERTKKIIFALRTQDSPA